MMKSVFFLAVLVNLIFFLWQYNAGAFYHLQDKIQIANKTPKQIWLVSELPSPSLVPVQVSAVTNNLNLTTTAPSLNLTAPLSVITPVEANHQQGVTSRVSDVVQTPPAAPITIAQTAEPIKTPEPSTTIANSEKTAALQTPAETIPPSDTKEPAQISKTAEIAVPETIKPTQVQVPKQSVVAPPETKQPDKTPPVKTLYCYQINGFSNKKTALYWGKQHAVDSASLQIKESSDVVDYMVYYPAATSLAESKTNTASLKKQGISHFMIHQGEFKGALSLGIFKNESYAIKVQQNLAQKGISAKVAKRHKTESKTAVQIKTDKTKSQLVASLARHNPKPSVKLLSKCD